MKAVRLDRSAKFLGKRLTELLCYFLIHRGELISQDRLIEQFWPESVNPPERFEICDLPVAEGDAGLC